MVSGMFLPPSMQTALEGSKCSAWSRLLKMTRNKPTRSRGNSGSPESISVVFHQFQSSQESQGVVHMMGGTDGNSRRVHVVLASPLRYLGYSSSPSHSESMFCADGQESCLSPTRELLVMHLRVLQKSVQAWTA